VGLTLPLWKYYKVYRRGSDKNNYIDELTSETYLIISGTHQRLTKNGGNNFSTIHLMGK
jgi:hypothetical protein